MYCTCVVYQDIIQKVKGISFDYNKTHNSHVCTYAHRHMYLHSQLMKSGGTQVESLTQKKRKLCDFIDIRWHLETVDIHQSTLNVRCREMN